MSDLNRVTLIGRLGADPETRHTQGGKTVCTLRLATGEKWRDKQTGEMQERTEWHSVVLFDRRAEVASEYLAKGSLVYIEGQLRTEKYTDKEGVERYTTKIYASDLKLLGSRPDGGRSHERAPAAKPAGRPAQRQAEPDFDDDLAPF